MTRESGPGGPADDVLIARGPSMPQMVAAAVMVAAWLPTPLVVRTAAARLSPPPAIVIAELFTSEGCSSCPPADSLLRELVTTQPLAGIDVVELESHVDYWDELGWHDPFSSSRVSTRQSAYAAQFRLANVYTPELVVDGTFQCVGSDIDAVRQTILQAARQPKGRVLIRAAAGDHRLTADLRAELPATLRRHGAADLWLAITEDGLVTKVTAGENGGRSLAHGSVMRTLTMIGHLGQNQATGTATVSVPLGDGWNRNRLRIVGFVPEHDGRRILAAADTELEPQRHPRGE